MMNKQILKGLLTISILLCALPVGRAQKINQPELKLSGEEVVLRRNRVLIETIRTPGAHPSATIFPVRSYAMMHATIFSLFFGRDDIPFQHTWEGTPTGWTRSYPSFTAMANEVAESRIYAGFHFRFDNVAGQAVGQNVGNYVFLNFMRPRACL